MSTTVNKTPAVNSDIAQIAAMRPVWAMIDALLGGTDIMRAKGESYLPKWPKEDDESYAARLSKSTLFPAFKRTVTTLAARPFSKPITLDEKMDERLKKMADNIDMQGNNLDVFAAEQFKGAMSHGMEFIFVEHPRRPADVKTQADEARTNMRPYFVRIRAAQVLGWRTTVNNNVTTLAQFRFMEEVEEQDGDFGTKTVQQVRVLEPGSWRTFRQATSGGAWAEVDNGVTTLNVIPIVPVLGERAGFMMGKPPLLQLAHLNIKHWQQQSDQDNLMHVVRVPILVAKSVSDKFSLTVGSSSAVKLGDAPQADLFYCEHSGAAIGAGKTQLDDLCEEMRQSGAELLVLRPGPATATEVASDNAVGMCALQEMASGMEDALDMAFEFAAQYIGASGNGGHCSVFKDFGAATLAEASASLLVGMKNNGGLSGETLFNELKRRGIISADVEWSEELERINAEGPPEPPPEPGAPPANAKSRSTNKGQE